MERGTQNMTQGSVKRVMLQFALPVFLSQLFQQLYNTADSLIVGNLLGKEALAAVSSSSPLLQLLTSLMIGISMGAGVVISATSARARMNPSPTRCTPRWPLGSRRGSS